MPPRRPPVRTPARWPTLPLPLLSVARIACSSKRSHANQGRWLLLQGMYFRPIDRRIAVRREARSECADRDRVRANWLSSGTVDRCRPTTLPLWPHTWIFTTPSTSGIPPPAARWHATSQPPRRGPGCDGRADQRSHAVRDGGRRPTGWSAQECVRRLPGSAGRPSLGLLSKRWRWGRSAVSSGPTPSRRKPYPEQGRQAMTGAANAE